MGKKLLSLLLALTLALTVLPAGALAAEAEDLTPEAWEDEAEAVVEERLAEPDPEVLDTLAEAGLLENDDAFSAYVDLALAGLLDDPPALFGVNDPAGGRLQAGSIEKQIYDDLKPKIADVASKGGTTVFDVSEYFKEFTLNAENFENSFGPTVDGKLTLKESVEKAIAKQLSFNSKSVMQALLLDCPYELYWFKKAPNNSDDKRAGMETGASYRYGTSNNGTVLTVTPTVTLTFYVVPVYQNGNDTTVQSEVSSAKNKINEIIEKSYASDYERLKGYVTEICNLVDYNHDAVTDNEAYGNPWQLIWVFDGDKTTKVVCEGYSKAFQYLCDLSKDKFTGRVECYTVTGNMKGGTGAGAHMWNIVTIEGANYLVDVTNCDTGSIGAPDKLFLAGAPGATESGFTVNVNGTNVSYTYDLTLPWSADILELASESYLPEYDPEVTSIQIFKNSDKTPLNLEKNTDGVFTGSDSIVKGGSATYTAKILDQHENEISASVKWTCVEKRVEGNSFTLDMDTTYTEVDLYVDVEKGDGTFSGIAKLTIQAVDKENHTLTVTPETLNLSVGENAKITVACEGCPGEKATYTSSDPAIASVTSDGTITAAAKGEAQITVTVEETTTHGAASKVVPVTVSAKSLENVAVKITGDTVYTGSAIEPTVTIDGLTKDTDYTVSYRNNTNVGTGEITITGKDNYSGTKKVTFEITPATITKVDVTDITGTIPANDQNNKSDKLKEAITLPTLANVTFAGGTASLNVTWTGPAEAFNPQGRTYTFTGKVETGTNFQPYTGLKATLTVTPVSVTEITAAGLNTTVTKTKGDVTAAGATLDTLGIPTLLTATFSDGSTTELNANWDKTIADLVSLANSVTDAEKSATITANPQFPDWATVDVGFKMPAVTFTVTPKQVAKVTVNVSDKDYDGTSVNPSCTAVDEKNQSTALTGDWTYTYKDASGKTSSTAPKDAGTYTLEAVFSNDNFQGSGSATFTIAPKPVNLTWSGTETRPYDKTASQVTAVVTAGELVNGDSCTVSVTGGDAVNAGTYTATAVLSNGNYTPAETAKIIEYTIAKAERNLALAPETLNLYPKTGLSGTVTATFADADKSAKPEFSLADIADDEASSKSAVTLSVNGSTATVKAVGNGRVRLDVSIEATDNYKAGSATCDVEALAQPVLGISVGMTEGSAENMTASLSEDTIKVVGLGNKNDIKLKLIMPEGITALTQDPNDSTVIEIANNLGKIAVKDGANIIAEYIVDVSGVETVTLPENTSIAAGESKAEAPADAEQAVKDAATNLAPSASGLTGAAKDVLVEAANNAAVPEGGRVVIEAGLQVEVKSLDTTSAVKTFRLDVTPVYVVKTTMQDGTEEEAPAQKITAPMKAEVTVSVTLPAGFPLTDVFARHFLSGSKTEILPVTVDSGTRTASWRQSSFSEVELFSDSRKGSITFTFDNDTQTIPYNAASIGTKLPVAEKAGQEFEGWIITEGGTAYTEVTEALLTELGKTGALSLTPKFKNNTPVDPGPGTEEPGPTPTPTPPTVTPGGGSSSGGSSSSGGGSRGTSYSSSATRGMVSVASASHGSVSFSPKTPVKGKTVTLTLRPDSGYALDSLRVLDSKGGEVDLTKVSDTQFTFTMPAGKVTVEASFTGGQTESKAFPFADAADSWARDAIAWAYEKGCVNGVSATAFNPNGGITRQQMWMILARLSGESPANMAAAREWALSSGITDGTNGSAPMSRQQMVTFLCRYAQGQGYSLTPGTGLDAFPDAASVSAYAREPLAWALASGVLTGTSDGRLNPTGGATRAQFAVILQRFDHNVVAP